MKSKVDKLDVNKLVPVPVDLSKLSDAGKKDVVKKTEYDELVKKVNAIHTTVTSNLVWKTDYNSRSSELFINKLLTMIVINIFLLTLVMIMINIFLLKNLIS